jgi:hypothetical protein
MVCGQVCHRFARTLTVSAAVSVLLTRPRVDTGLQNKGEG